MVANQTLHGISGNRFKPFLSLVTREEEEEEEEKTTEQ